ncbi:hypothetical protein F511_01855 [Dorcoceras hygrometricum]|uniref:Uncharacterized protein n=1 Tax=Dorcoceras hygrometricum TaxID=472368 RepID=A0A2Z7CW88_9LAMI|nr:hypothetical protein F511_01855 [Dorcoceras hygrometricum]
MVEVDDEKHQDDRESDAGELISPASQGQHSHQDLLKDGEEVVVEKQESSSTFPMESLKIDGNEEPNLMIEDESGGEVKREFEIPSELDKEDGRIGYDEPSKKPKAGSSYDSSSGSGGSSSSYDESNGITNTKNVDGSPVHNSVKAAAVPERPFKALHSDTIEDAADSSCPIEKSADRCAVESLLDEKEDEEINPFEHYKVQPVAFMDTAASEKVEEETILPIENVSTISDPKTFETLESGHRMTQGYNPAGAKDSAVSELLLAPASHTEKTSWKSCCGLLEVFARSDR